MGKLLPSRRLLKQFKERLVLGEMNLSGNVRWGPQMMLQFLTGEGAVTVQVPRVRETETGFRSKILDAYVSRTQKLDELIARM